MTIKELKLIEQSYLNAEQARLKEYAIAYRDIIDMCERNAGLKLSENILLSDMSKKYLDKITFEYNITKKENLRLRAKAASDLFIYKTIPFDQIHSDIVKYRNLDFENVRSILEDKPYYDLIDPKTVKSVIEFILMNRGL